MQNLQNIQSLSSFSRKFGGSVTLQSYIKSLSGLVAYYPMDETSGNMINRAPATLGSYDGTVTGATQNVDGSNGKAYSFDGNDEVITTAEMFRNRSAYSIVAIMNVVHTGSYKTIAYESMNLDVNQARMHLTISDVNKLRFFGRAGAGEGGKQKLSDSAISEGAHLMVCNVNIATDTVKLYIDGEEIAASGTTDFAATSTENTAAAAKFRVGSSVNGGVSAFYWNSLLQHIAVLDRVLTVDEIETIGELSGFFF